MNFLKKPASIIAATLILGLGAGAAQAGFFQAGSSGTIRATGGCFVFGSVCAIGGTGNTTDNADTVTNLPGNGSIAYGTGIAGDGYVAIWDFTVGSDGNTLTITSFSQDTYPATAGGKFALFAPSGTGAMTATVDASGKLDLNLTGRYGIPEFFVDPATGGWPNGNPWNIDNAASANVVGETGLQEILSTGSVAADDPSTAGQQSILQQTGENLALTAPNSNTWTGVLVSSGNVGSAWGFFDGTPYTESFAITVTGIQGDGNPCSPTAFTFTPQTDVALNQTIESNVVTIAGITATCAITVTTGEYQIDGGAWTIGAGTINAGQTVRVRHTSSIQSSTSVTTVLTVGTISRNFISTTLAPQDVDGSNFTMLDPFGSAFGGTNDVQVTWNGQFSASTSDRVTGPSGAAPPNMTISSPTKFFIAAWTAHHIRVFDQGGPYIINTECTVPQLETGTCTPNIDPSKNYTFTVGPNQVGAHILFDWNNTADIDVIAVWTKDAKYEPSPMKVRGDTGCNNPETIWDLMSSDWDNDGKNGAAMIDGPFIGYSANFNLRLPNSTNPILLCSGGSTYVPTVNVDDPSGAKGCSISQKPVSILQRGDWWLVAGFLVWLGAARRRHKRISQTL